MLKKAPGISTRQALKKLKEQRIELSGATFRRAKTKFLKQSNQFGEHSILGSRDAEIAKRLFKGDSLAKIAREMKISRNTVYNVSDLMEKHGIPASLSGRKILERKKK